MTVTKNRSKAVYQHNPRCSEYKRVRAATKCLLKLVGKATYKMMQRDDIVRQVMPRTLVTKDKE
jgi:hypothetical protein